jgi:hypothetical protein
MLLEGFPHLQEEMLSCFPVFDQGVSDQVSSFPRDERLSGRETSQNSYSKLYESSFAPSGYSYQQRPYLSGYFSGQYDMTATPDTGYGYGYGFAGEGNLASTQRGAPFSPQSYSLPKVDQSKTSSHGTLTSLAPDCYSQMQQLPTSTGAEELPPYGAYVSSSYYSHPIPGWVPPLSYPAYNSSQMRRTDNFPKYKSGPSARKSRDEEVSVVPRGSVPLADSVKVIDGHSLKPVRGGPGGTANMAWPNESMWTGTLAARKLPSVVRTHRCTSNC